ncbi:kinesin [Pycnococcus provasolii]
MADDVPPTTPRGGARVMPTTPSSLLRPPSSRRALRNNQAGYLQAFVDAPSALSPRVTSSPTQPKSLAFGRAFTPGGSTKSLSTTVATTPTRAPLAVRNVNIAGMPTTPRSAQKVPQQREATTTPRLHTTSLVPNPSPAADATVASLFSPPAAGDGGTPSKASKDTIKVAIRVRPQTHGEKAQGATTLTASGDQVVRIASSLSGGGNDLSQVHNFTFDRVLDSSHSQADVYTCIGRPIVENVITGFNAAILAYGQTGSGKTFTMIGPDVDSDDAYAALRHTNRGLAPRVFERLFSRIAEAGDAESSHYSVSMSLIEIYCEAVYDLLVEMPAPSQPASPAATTTSADGDSEAGDSDEITEEASKTSAPPTPVQPPRAESLQLREDPSRGGVRVIGVTELPVTCAAEAMARLRQGSMNRHVAMTNMNRESSRSHLVCSLEVTCTLADGRVRSSRLHLVDLAGSERQSKTGASGERLKEASGINKSLSALGLVILNLSNAQSKAKTNAMKQKHISYRDSKLTYLLQDSLGGNAKTAFVVNLSSARASAHETLSSLRFAARCKTVENRAKVNESQGSGQSAALAARIANLQAEVKRLRSENDAMHTLIGKCSGTAVASSSDEVTTSSALLLDSLRREAALAANLAAEQTKAENLAKLAELRDGESRTHEMKARFREERIKALEKQLAGGESLEGAEELRALKGEVETLKEETQRLRRTHPEIVRLAHDNHVLTAKLSEYPSSAPDVIARMNDEAAALRTECIAILERAEAATGGTVSSSEPDQDILAMARCAARGFVRGVLAAAVDECAQRTRKEYEYALEESEQRHAQAVAAYEVSLEDARKALDHETRSQLDSRNAATEAHEALERRLTHFLDELAAANATAEKWQSQTHVLQEENARLQSEHEDVLSRLSDASRVIDAESTRADDLQVSRDALSDHLTTLSEELGGVQTELANTTALHVQAIERIKELSEEIERVEALKLELQQSYGDVCEAHQAAVDRAANAEAQVVDLTTITESAQATTTELRSELAETRSAFADTKSAFDEATAKSESRIAELMEELVSVRQEADKQAIEANQARCSLVAELETATNQVAVQTAETHAAQRLAEGFQEKASAADARASEALEKASQVEAENGELREAASAADARASEALEKASQVEAENGELREAASAADARASEALEKASQVEAENGELREAASAADARASEALEKASQVEAENGELREVASAADARASEALEKASQVEAENGELREAASAADARASEALEKASQVEAENGELREAASAADARASEALEKASQVEAENGELREAASAADVRASEALEKASQVEAENGELREAASAADARASEALEKASQVEAENGELREAASAADARASEALEKASQVEAENGELREAASAADARASEALEKASQVEAENGELREAASAADARASEALEKASQVEAENGELREVASAADARASEALEKASQVEAENGELREAASAADARASESLEFASKLEAEADRLREAASVDQERATELLEKASYLETENGELRKTASAAVVENDEMRQALSMAEARASESLQAAQESLDKAVHLETENDELRRTTMETKESNATLVSEAQESRDAATQLGEAAARLENENGKLRSAIETAHEEAAEARERATDLESAVSRAEALGTKRLTQISEMKERRKEAEERVANVERLLESRDRLFQQKLAELSAPPSPAPDPKLKARVDQAEKARHEVEMQLARSKDEISKLGGERLRWLEELQEAVQAKITAVAKMDVMRAQTSNQQSELESKETELAETKSRVSHLEDEVSEFTSHNNLSQRINKHRQVKQENDELKRELHSMKERLTAQARSALSAEAVETIRAESNAEAEEREAALAGAICDAVSSMDIMHLVVDGAAAEATPVPLAVRRVSQALEFLRKRVGAYEATAGAMMDQIRGYAEAERLRVSLAESGITPHRRMSSGRSTPSPGNGLSYPSPSMSR